MPFEDIRQRLEAVQKVRSQRDAAERRIPGERLRRELREAFTRQSARKLRKDREVGMEPDPSESTNAKR
jgi:hypothetical protein